jgi:hypothetical protein
MSFILENMKRDKKRNGETVEENRGKGKVETNTVNQTKGKTVL